MVTFSFLDKSEKEKWLPLLFDLLYENMRHIAPGGLSREQEESEWMSNVSPALDKEPRKIILCLVDDRLTGYVQYYTRGQLVMVEEVQLRKNYQRTLMFTHLCRHLLQVLPPGISQIEAYADRRNLYSQRIMKKLGMHPVPEHEDSPFVHMRGDVQTVKSLFSFTKY